MIIIAEFDTAHFSFVAVSTTYVAVREALCKAWLKHCKDYQGADPGYMIQAIADGDVNYMEVPSTEAVFRDLDRIV